MTAVNAKRQLLVLFFSSFVILFVGMGLFPLLPLYAAQFGATRTFVGIYFAFMYISNAAGPILAGWLSSRLPRRVLFIALGLLGIPALVLAGQATSLWQVVVLTAIVWFSGGANLGLINIFTGLYADGKSRGKSFSLMSLAAPLGALIGGAASGRLLAWQGYPMLFGVMGAFWIALPLIGLLLLKDKPASSRPASSTSQSAQVKVQFGRDFYLLLGLSLLTATAISVGRLGTSLSMQSLGFSSGDVASSTTVSGLATIPITLLIGILSDRFGRKRFLVVTFLMAAGGALTLSMATQLWQFWLSATLMLVAFGTNGAMTSALATDILAPEELSLGLSWSKTTISLGSILSFAGAGYIMDTLGPRALFLIAATLPVLAVGLMRASSSRGRPALPGLYQRIRNIRLVGFNRSKTAGQLAQGVGAEGC